MPRIKPGSLRATVRYGGTSITRLERPLADIGRLCGLNHVKRGGSTNADSDDPIKREWGKLIIQTTSHKVFTVVFPFPSGSLYSSPLWEDECSPNE